MTDTPQLPTPHTSRNVRSNLADGIEKYWIGHEHTSNIGLQYLNLDRDTGTVYCSNRYERKDLLVLQVMDRVNVFVDPVLTGPTNYRVQIDTWNDVVLSATESDFYRSAGFLAIELNREFWEHECRFLREEPWKQVDGMTPTEAVAKLRELGW